MSHEVTVTTPPSRSPRAWNGEGEVLLGVVPLLSAQGREEEAQISLVAPEDVGPAEAEAAILPRTPDEPFVVDVCVFRRCPKYCIAFIGIKYAV
jgi:hypothetical protein